MKVLLNIDSFKILAKSGHSFSAGGDGIEFLRDHLRRKKEQSINESVVNADQFEAIQKIVDNGKITLDIDKVGNISLGKELTE